MYCHPVFSLWFFHLFFRLQKIQLFSLEQETSMISAVVDAFSATPQSFQKGGTLTSGKWTYPSSSHIHYTVTIVVSSIS